MSDAVAGFPASPLGGSLRCLLLYI